MNARGDRRHLLSGPLDPRKPVVVWRGTTGGFGGLKKGRNVFLQLGIQRPELIDSGVSDWNEAKHGPHNGKLKRFMSMREQVNRYKYQAWLPGNCASIRLSVQLAADSAVFKVEHDDMEWYYPLLKPYIHYIPFVANETHTNLLDQLNWAESHQEAVRAIVVSANAFAHRYLSGPARDCYFMQLLLRYSHLMHGQVSQPDNGILPPR